MKELSKITGISQGYISDIERENYDPTIRIICKLCKALEITPNDIINSDYWR
ncbi:MAG: helix-turn-helix transcriptional regulator [Clostridium sp.]|uniref:helix-turn-helix transcriptional regulator n=1 Tax=Clostridium sp. TaxID=1506 RepID=UPI00304CE14A